MVLSRANLPVLKLKSVKVSAGTAVANNQVMLVKDVHQFPGHIACDSASNSEIVIPLHKGNEIVGVLDIDSPVLARFDEEDQEGAGTLCQNPGIYF